VIKVFVLISGKKREIYFTPPYIVRWSINDKGRYWGATYLFATNWYCFNAVVWWFR